MFLKLKRGLFIVVLLGSFSGALFAEQDGIPSDSISYPQLFQKVTALNGSDPILWRELLVELPKKLSVEGDPSVYLLELERMIAGLIHEHMDQSAYETATKLMRKIAEYSPSSRSTYVIEMQGLTAVIKRLGKKAEYPNGRKSQVFKYIATEIIPDRLATLPNTPTSPGQATERVKMFLDLFSSIPEKYCPEFFDKMVHQILDKEGPQALKPLVDLDKSREFHFLQERTSWLKHTVMSTLSNTHRHNVRSFISDMCRQAVTKDVRNQFKELYRRFPNPAQIIDSEIRKFLDSRSELTAKGGWIFLTDLTGWMNIPEKQLTALLKTYDTGDVSLIEVKGRKIIKRKR